MYFLRYGLNYRVISGYLYGMKDTLLKEALVINRGKITEMDVLVRNNRIERTDRSISVPFQVDEVAVGGLRIQGRRGRRSNLLYGNAQYQTTCSDPVFIGG